MRVSPFSSFFAVVYQAFNAIKKPASAVVGYGLPVLVVAICGTAVEFDEYQHVVAKINEAARRDSQAYANLIMERLDTRFTELDMALAALRGSDNRIDPPLSPQVEMSLRHYLLSRPAYSTFSVLGADGESIQWSTSDQKKTRDEPLRDFSPVPKMPYHFLGPVHYSETLGTVVLSMRVREKDNGNAGYFLGSPYRISRFLDEQELPPDYRNWDFTVIDTRSGQSLTQLLHMQGQVHSPLSARQEMVVLAPVPGYPFVVQTLVSSSRVWHTYSQQAPARWSAEVLLLALLLLFSEFLIRRRDREQMVHLRRLTDFNTFMAQASQCASQANDEAGLLQEICDMAIRYTHFKIALITRPDEAQWFQMLAMSGARAYLNNIAISARADLPEGKGTIGRVWRTGLPLFNVSFSNNATLAPWKERALRMGLRSNTALPIYRDGKVWAVFSVYHEKVDIFDDQLQILLKEVCINISMGLDRIYSQQLRTAFLDNSLVGILLVKNRVVQMNNSYTTYMLGLESDALVGKPTEIIYAEKSEFNRITESYEQIAQNRTVRVTGVRLARSDGQMLIVDFSGVKLSDLQNDVSVWTLEDVTSREVARRLYHALVNTADAVLLATNENEMCSRACQDLVRDTLFHAVWIGRVSELGPLEVLAHAGEGTEGIEQINTNLDGDCSLSPPLVVTRAWREKDVVYSNDELAEQADSPCFEFIYANNWRAVLSAPIRRDGQIWAVMTFVSPQTQVFDESSIALCKRVTSLLGHALDKLDVNRRIEGLQEQEAARARHDVLTGLPNRLALTEYLPQALARAQRQATSVAVGLIDLDGFKLVNDTYGHEAGDRLLQQLGQSLQARLRQTDYVARLGGDEFVVVFEGLTTAQAVEQVEVVLTTLHAAVEKPFPVTVDETATVGMTLGVALYPQDGLDAEYLLKRADKAMYHAKQNKKTREKWWFMAKDLVDDAQDAPLP
ncbi:diguanylate cyclase domain-containing protein [Acetobacter fabarum]|uniref:sensor domain-containing diguanylate cyclase n=1 Tax=Acetobacter fabarum TaxID=483199 RepID=UPI00383A1473